MEARYQLRQSPLLCPSTPLLRRALKRPATQEPSFDSLGKRARDHEILARVAVRHEIGFLRTNPTLALYSSMRQ